MVGPKYFSPPYGARGWMVDGVPAALLPDAVMSTSPRWTHLAPGDWKLTPAVCGVALDRAVRVRWCAVQPVADEPLTSIKRLPCCDQLMSSFMFSWTPACAHA